jgi:hypothetical protein
MKQWELKQHETPTQGVGRANNVKCRLQTKDGTGVGWVFAAFSSTLSSTKLN